MQPTSRSTHPDHDAVLVPGGGLDPDGGIPRWTQARLDRAIEEPGEPVIITLSAGTVHKPPPLDDRGFPVLESAAAAHYLIDRGVSVDRTRR